MKYLYYVYQLFVGLPFVIISTLITALTVAIGCTLGNGHFWGYYPGRWWGYLILKVLLLPVKVEGRENLEKDQSYVFVANHQGAFDQGHLRQGSSDPARRHQPHRVSRGRTYLYRPHVPFQERCLCPRRRTATACGAADHQRVVLRYASHKRLAFRSLAPSHAYYSQADRAYRARRGQHKECDGQELYRHHVSAGTRTSRLYRES